MDFRFLFLIILVCISSGSVLAQNTAVIHGVVTSERTEKPLIAANVYLPQTFLGTSSDSDGRYTFQVPPGKHTLICDYIYHQAVKRSIALAAGDTLQVNFALVEQVERLGTVTVESERERTLSTFKINRESLKNAPGLAEPDLVRPLGFLPGIILTNDLTSNLNIRGGASDQNRFLFEGIDVFQPTHFRGLFSAFNVFTIGDIDVYTADFPASEPGQLSGLVNAHAIEPLDSLYARLNLSISSGAFALANKQGPVSLVLGARRTWLDKAISDPAEELDYNFYDLNGKLIYQFSPHLRFETIGFFNQDHFMPNKDNFKWGNWAAGLRMIYDNGRIRQSVQSSHSAAINEGREANESTYIDTRLQKKVLRYDVGYISPKLLIDAGLSSEKYHLHEAWEMSHDANPEDLFSTEVPFSHTLEQKLVLQHGYLKFSHKINANWMATSFLRMTFCKQAEKNWLLPGGSLSYSPSDQLHFSTSWQRNVQFLSIGFEGKEYTLGNLYRLFDQPLRADVATLNTAWLMNSWLKLRLSFWHKSFNNLVRLADDPADYPNFSPYNGHTTGADFFLEKSKGWLTWQVAYSITKTDFSAGSKQFFPAWDIPHALKTVLGFRLGTSWICTISGACHSGLLYASPVGRYFTVTDETDRGYPPFTQNDERFIVDTEHPQRFSPYFRLDMALRKKYHAWFGDWILFIQVQNMTFHRNVLRSDWRDYFLQGKPDPSSGLKASLPVIPSFGIEVQF